MTRRPPDDPEEHAKQFSHDWAERLEEYVRNRMRELGIPEARIGVTDIEAGGVLRAFFPDESDGGGNSPGGRLNLDSGMLNPELDAARLGPEAAALWAKSRLRDRIDALIAHEYEESACGDHDEAAGRAPDTVLQITDNARRLLRAIANREKPPACG